MTSKLQSPEQNERIEKAEKLCTENIRLAYWVLKNRFPDFKDDEDLAQEALIGLWKACLNFDEEKAKFASFAVVCISNEIRMALRKRQRQRKLLSIDALIEDTDGLTVLETLEDPNAQIDESGVAVKAFISTLRPKDQDMVKFAMIGLPQKEIAKRVGVSQPCVSRAMSRIQKRFLYKGRFC